jgi:hypothetical protein
VCGCEDRDTHGSEWLTGRMRSFGGADCMFERFLFLVDNAGATLPTGANAS